LTSPAAGQVAPAKYLRKTHFRRFAASQLYVSTLRIVTPPKEIVMTASTKTPLEHVGDVLKQLKDMRHHSKNNVEHLTEQWLLFDGELKALKQAEAIEALMMRQSELHSALEAQIEALEALAVELTPKEEEPETTAPQKTRH
jgi:hypothetical protein